MGQASLPLCASAGESIVYLTPAFTIALDELGALIQAVVKVIDAIG
jgi:hypothetical protein